MGVGVSYYLTVNFLVDSVIKPLLKHTYISQYEDIFDFVIGNISLHRVFPSNVPRTVILNLTGTNGNGDPV